MSVRIAKPPTKTLQSIVPLMHLWSTPEVSDFVAKANREYYYWDELRRRPLPKPLSAEDAWLFVKMSRQPTNVLPLRDANGRPFAYWLPNQAHQILHTIDRKGGGSLAFDLSDPLILPELQDRVLIDSLMEEAIATS